MVVSQVTLFHGLRCYKGFCGSMNFVVGLVSCFGRCHGFLDFVFL